MMLASGYCQLDQSPVQYVHLCPSELESSFEVAYSAVHRSCYRGDPRSGQQPCSRPLKVHLFTPEMYEAHPPSRQSVGLVTNVPAAATGADRLNRCSSKRHCSPAGVVRYYYGSEDFGFTVHDNLVLEPSAFCKVKTKSREQRSIHAWGRRRYRKDMKPLDNLTLKTCDGDKNSASPELEDSKSRHFSACIRSPCGASAARKLSSSPSVLDERPALSSDPAANNAGEHSGDEDMIKCPTCKCRVLHEAFPAHYLAHHRRKRKTLPGNSMSRPIKMLKEEPVDKEVVVSGRLKIDDEMDRESPSSTDEVLHPVPIRFKLSSHMLLSEGIPLHAGDCSCAYCSSSESVTHTGAASPLRLVHPAAPPMYSMQTGKMRHPASPDIPVTSQSERPQPCEFGKCDTHQSYSHGQTHPSVPGACDTRTSVRTLPHPAVACQTERSYPHCGYRHSSSRTHRSESGAVVKKEDRHLCQMASRPVSPGPPPPLISDCK